MDSDDALMEDSLKKMFLGNISKQAEYIAKNIVIVHLQFQSSEVEMTTQESRSAFLGGIIIQNLSENFDITLLKNKSSYFLL